LKITSNTQNQCTSQAVKILNLQEYPLIFIHMDKPVYKPEDVLKLRVFILNQKLLRFTGQTQISVKVYDSTGSLIQIFPDVRTSKFGLIEKSITIPENQNFGKWKIEVQANNRKKSTEFQVQSHLGGDFDVFMDIPDVLAYRDQNFTMNILVKGENDRFVDGSAKISVTEILENGRTKHLRPVEVTGIKTEVKLSFVEDLNLLSLNNDIDLKFHVEVTDLLTQKVVTVQKVVTLYHKDKHLIQVTRKSYFKPGFDFALKIRVKNMNGVPDKATSQLTMTVEYQNRNGITLNKKTSALKLINGVASDVLHPRAAVHKMVIHLDVEGTLHVENVEKFSAYGVDEHMQVNFVNKR